MCKNVSASLEPLDIGKKSDHPIKIDLHMELKK